MKKLVLVFLLIIPFFTFSQVYFNNRFGFDTCQVWDAAFTAIETTDGYIVGGVTGDCRSFFWHRVGLKKIDFNGNYLGEILIGDTIRRFYIERIIKTNDGNFLFAGTTENYNGISYGKALIIKFNEELDTIWSKEFGDKIMPIDTSNGIYYLNKNSAGNFILIGEQYYYGTISKILFIKTNSAGNKLSEKTYSYYGGYNRGYSVIQTSDGGYAIGGLKFYFGSNPNDDPILIKTDSLGNQQWMKNLGGNYKDGTALVCNAKDGNFVVAINYADSSIYDVSWIKYTLAKYNNQGVELWKKTYGKRVYEGYISDINATYDGSYILTGTYGGYIGWMLKVSPEGDSLWYREYRNLGGNILSNNVLYSGITTSDNGFIACGYVYPMPPDTGTQDAWLLKVDSLGCESPSFCWVGVKEPGPAPGSITGDAQISIAPNPAKETAVVSWKGEAIKLEVYSSDGRKVFDTNLKPHQNEIRLSINHWPPGLYLVRVALKTGSVIAGKILKE